MAETSPGDHGNQGGLVTGGSSSSTSQSGSLSVKEDHYSSSSHPLCEASQFING